MKKLLLISALLIFSSVSYAQLLSLKFAAPTPATGNCPNTGNPSDGCSTGPKPGVTGQFSTMLNSYSARRPNWNVACVDYAVGITSGTTLKDPATISMPGVSVNTSTAGVAITGQNVTLDGYDFSLNGGYGIFLNAANTGGTLTITNSKFIMGAKDNPPVEDGTVNNNGGALKFWNNEVTGSATTSPGSGGILNWHGNGIDARYNLIQTVGADVISQVSFGNNVILKYNCFKDIGLAPLAHADVTQLQGGPFTLDWQFNTFWQTSGDTQGFMTEGVVNATINNNTMTVSGSGSVNFFTSMDGQDFTGSSVVLYQNNYVTGMGIDFSYTGTPGVSIYPCSTGTPGFSQVTYSGNVDLASGPNYNCP